MFDVKQFLEDKNIEYSTEGKNTQRGWANIQCPMCGDSSNHGGFNLTTGHYNCWHCGHHWTDQIVAKLLTCSVVEARKIIEEYQTGSAIIERKPVVKNNTKLDFPVGTKGISKRHKNYLIKRNFDPKEIEKTWKIKGTGFLGDYKFRIIIPVILNGVMVSYVGRDITEQADLRYKACKMEDEITHHKHILYGIDYVKNREAIIVEGATDVWRIGKGAIATFGTSYTAQQLLMMATSLDTAFVLYDRDAFEKAKQLQTSLSGLIKHVEIIVLPPNIKDPSDMEQLVANRLRKEILTY